MIRHHWLFLAAALLLGSLPATTQAQALALLTEELPPLNYSDESGLTGLSVTIVREILRRVDHPDTIQVVPWARGYKAALEEPNVVLFSTTRTEEREDLFKWVGPLVRWSYVFYKRRGSPITLKHLDDARRVGSIATYRDDAREEFLLEQGFTNLDSSPKLISCARKLLEGRVDLWLDSNLTAYQLVKQLGAEPGAIEPVLTVKTNYLYIAFSKQTDDAVVERWQTALDAMYRDGTLRGIYRQWLPGEEPPAAAPDAIDTQAALAGLRLLTEELPPWNYTDAGNLTGLSTEIVREIMRRLALRQTIEVMPWSRAYNLALGTPNIALFSTVRTAQRESLFHWVGPIGRNDTTLYARRDFGTALHTLDDARGIDSIGTYRDDVDEQFLRARGFTNIYSHGTPDAIVRNLMAGRIQVWAAGSLYAPLILKRAGYSFDQVRPVLRLRETQVYIAFSRATPTGVIAVWQEILDAMTREGVVAAIQARWLDGSALD